jgi:hypothetical protein
MQARWSLWVLVAVIASGCQSDPGIVGKWNIEQDNNALGEGAEKGVLELKDDETFTLTMGPLTMASGTYEFSENKLTLSQGATQMGATYVLEGGKLIPVNTDGSKATAWRFVR